MDINQMLKGINKEMKQLEKDKKDSLLSDIREGNLRALESIWTLRKKEKKALDDFAHKIRGYRPVHVVQGQVIAFAQNQPMTHITIAAIKSDASADVDKYIDKSQYWEKKSVTIKVNVSTGLLSKKVEQKIVYAQNKEMRSVIFSIDEYIYIATRSSFENYLSLLEGKPIRDWKDEKQTHIEMMQQIVEAF